VIIITIIARFAGMKKRLTDDFGRNIIIYKRFIPNCKGGSYKGMPCVIF